MAIVDGVNNDAILRFGKHRHKHMSDVDVQYLDWLLGATNDKHLKKQLLAHLNNRPEWKTM